MSTQTIITALEGCASAERARVSASFFRTGPGEYGEGDVFMGVSMPDVRTVARRFADVELDVVEKLLADKVHEVRMCGVLIVVYKYEAVSQNAKRGAYNVLDCRVRSSRTRDDLPRNDTTKEVVRRKKELYDFYLAHLAGVNNWDLVDASATQIVGQFLLEHSRSRQVLMRLARSEDLWERRVAIVATFAIGDVVVADGDARDLTHKALGWMLREVWKRDAAACEDFLRTHYDRLPRTTLRYAIERMAPETRKKWLKGTRAAVR